LFEIGAFLKRMFYVRIVTAFKVQIMCESSTLVPASLQGPLNELVHVLSAAGGVYRLQFFFFQSSISFSSSFMWYFTGRCRKSVSGYRLPRFWFWFLVVANIMLLLFAWASMSIAARERMPVPGCTIISLARSMSRGR
jgi:hypothetical protein